MTYHGAALGVAALEYFAVSLHVRRPLCALLNVARVVFPVLGRVIEPSEQPLFLLGGGDIEEALDQYDALLHQVVLPGIDLVIALPPHRLLNQIVDPHHQDVLVMGPVENANQTGRWQLALNAPQEMVCPLLLGRSLESLDLHSLGIDHADRVPDDSPFP